MAVLYSLLVGIALGICVSFVLYTISIRNYAHWQNTFSVGSFKLPAIGEPSTYHGPPVSDMLNDQTRPRKGQPARILCMILTMPSNHDSKALAVKRTWASRCDDYFFVSSTNDPDIPALAAVQYEERNSLWDKVKFGILYATHNYTRPFDYFFKADDDTYVIMENLRKLVQQFDSKQSILTGRRFKPFSKQGYASGGGGYVISRLGLQKIAENLKPGKLCGDDLHTWAEDVEIGKCADAVGVQMMDSLDDNGLERFHPFTIHGMMHTPENDTSHWLPKYNYHTLRNGTRCCSNDSITFHYITVEDMYTYDFLLYRVRGAHLNASHQNEA